MISAENNTYETKQQAKALRKAGEYDKAKDLYESLWTSSKDQFDGAGLLQCLRKLDRFDEAIPVAEELAEQQLDLEWCRREVIWTFLQGQLLKLPENERMENVVAFAAKIMKLSPDGLAAKLTVFRVLKAAKAEKRWDVINDWVVRLNPEELSGEPIKSENGREGWCDQSLWYNYRLNGLFETGNYPAVIKIVDEILGKYPKENKFFLRLKGRASHRLGDLKNAEQIYSELCSSRRTDWWLLHEYALVLIDINRKEEALLLMYRAAASNPKLELMVSMFSDIANVCKELGRVEEARNHLVLSKHVREQQGWPIGFSLKSQIDQLEDKLTTKAPESFEECMTQCKKLWKAQSVERDDYERKPKRGLIGLVKASSGDRPFCFIDVKGENSYFCFKSDLPTGLKNGDQVSFDAIPSFDKKKNKPSWKASNVKVVT
jgi:tetratricopeptide (TPR) repeat protein